MLLGRFALGSRNRLKHRVVFPLLTVNTPGGSRSVARNKLKVESASRDRHAVWAGSRLESAKSVDSGLR